MNVYEGNELAKSWQEALDEGDGKAVEAITKEVSGEEHQSTLTLVLMGQTPG